MVKFPTQDYENDDELNLDLHSPTYCPLTPQHEAIKDREGVIRGCPLHSELEIIFYP